MLNQQYQYTPFAFETLTVSSASAVVSLTETVYRVPGGLPAQAAVITVDPGAVISYLYAPGVTVDTGTGHQASAFGKLELFGEDQIRNFRTTSTKTATTGQISVTYFR